MSDQKSEAEVAPNDKLCEETDRSHATLMQKAIKRTITDLDTCVDRLTSDEPTAQLAYDTFSIVYDKRAETYDRDTLSLVRVTGRVECECDLPDNPEGIPHGKHLPNDDCEFPTSTVHYDSDADGFCYTRR